MKTYEYPRVRPPTSLQAPQQPPENRFSWMDTPAEEESRVWANNTRRGTNAPAPTQMPNQQGQTMEPYRYAVGGYPYQGQDTAVAQQQHQHQQPYVPDSRHYSAHTAQLIPAPQTQLLQEQSSPQPQPPEPAKQPPNPENEPTGPIVPDLNPLTPATPKPPNRQSTNMAIVPPPTDPSSFSVSTFTPSPQTIRGGSWQHGLCSCAEPSTCLTGLFCPCMVYGKTQYRLSLRAERKDPTNLLGYTAVNGSCIAFGILCGFNGVLAAIQHTRVRKTYNMNTEAGNVAGDCLKGICCCCCVVAQDEKEVKFREERARKPSGTKKEGYVAPTGMTFNPPPR
ncbi:uncharacterized protein Z518_03120 [Rhinocladiella mackenziei CBS 650.93]|uniref:Rhinocladiella mackenziei CBS 650.93 unplaced genomic scaffold supercont1.2, whole genome shotgun sequence n=1 Tax=Rhinocladiella mackenziei CBS 650.93 TaxID=1442369 RepID=A0A0D2IR76_9EURO|nr:uncharacterized protein Z518_03120 [Rhinocladiella mackenziei CBS 650.93]KIX08464.1 hypothetical protein Z518_03120 [Rhinocladiella mackenziei CBS 650.93]